MLICVFTVIIVGYLSTSIEACNTGEPDGTGVELLGTKYDCKYLRSYHPEDKYIGIYNSRKFHCQMPHTDCCETCNHVLSCQDAPGNGIYLAEMYFNCSFLQKYHTDDEYVGIYKNRKSICKQSTTDCCESCEKVFNEVVESTTSGIKETTTTTTTATPTQQSSIETSATQLKDTCTYGCLWIGDGSVGECSWLLDQSQSAAYNMRLMLCMKGFTNGCERTCDIVITESKNSGQKGELTTVRPTTRPACEDTVVIVNKDFYACSDLLNPNSNIYNNRQAFCSSNKSACCLTCQRVVNEKPSGVIKYTDENQIGKNGIVIEQIPQTAQNIKLKSTKKSRTPTSVVTTAQPATNQLSSLLHILKATSDRLQREEEKRRNALNALMSNIMSTFFRLQKAGNTNTNFK